MCSALLSFVVRAPGSDATDRVGASSDSVLIPGNPRLRAGARPGVPIELHDAVRRHAKHNLLSATKNRGICGVRARARACDLVPNTLAVD